MNVEKENKFVKKVDFAKKNYKTSVYKWRHKKKVDKFIEKLQNNS